MPDFNPATPAPADGWGHGATAANFATKSYLNGYIPSTTSSAGTNGTESIACSASNGGRISL